KALVRKLVVEGPERGIVGANRSASAWIEDSLRRRRDERLGDVCHSLRSPYMRRFSSGSLSKTSGHRRLNARLADIGFICGIGRSVVALPPFLKQDATPNCEIGRASCRERV